MKTLGNKIFKHFVVYGLLRSRREFELRGYYSECEKIDARIAEVKAS